MHKKFCWENVKGRDLVGSFIPHRLTFGEKCSLSHKLLKCVALMPENKYLRSQLFVLFN
jgi:hypothetical protein